VRPAVVGPQERAQRLADLGGGLEVAGLDVGGEHLALEPLGQPGGVVEQVGPVLAVDRVDEALDHAQRAGRRLTAAWVHEA
jgi:hypothetical protein